MSVNKRLYSVVAFGLGLSFLVLVSFFYHRNTLTYDFGDEQDNFVLGKFVTEGKTIYGDLFSHHQPLAYVISASVQTISPPDNIYLLISRHRLLLIIWAAVWFLLLVKKIGWLGPVFVVGYEFGKAFIFGHLFLSESLAAYPLVFLGAVLIEKGAQKKWESIMVGVATATVLLLLSPLWPVTLVMVGLLFWQKKVSRQTILYFIGGLLIPIFICLPFISFRDYLFNAFYINYQYFIPWSSTHGDKISPLAFLTPVMPFVISKGGNFLNIIRLWSALYIIAAALNIKRHSGLVLGSFFILGLANLRYTDPASEIYQGFHLLPYFALLIIFAIALLKRYIDESKTALLKKIPLVALLIISSLATIWIAKGLIFTPVNQTDSFFINYSQAYDVGEVIRLTKDSNDTLLSTPGTEWLIYWQADINNASKMINYFAWMQLTPPLRANVDKAFEKKENYPTYFYCECKDSYLNQYLGSYVPFIKEGKATNLYVLKEKALEISDKQREEIKRLNYSLEPIAGS